MNRRSVAEHCANNPSRSSWLRAPLVTAVLGFAMVFAGPAGCKNRKTAGSLAELVPPKDAPAWESRFAVAFDDTYTPTAVNLEGRAPNDVLDQQLFQARLGHAAIVVLVRVQQVWGKGRYEGRQAQYLELEVGEVLLGSLPKDAPERLMLEVDSADDLPGALNDEVMMLFLRWDPEAEPPFHHHLMPAADDLIALINAMVEHAQAEGVLDAKGDEKKSGKRRRTRKAKKRAGKRGEGQGSDASEPASQVSGTGSGTPIGGEAAPPGGTDGAANEPPPASGPEPDASTGLDKLGGEPDPAPAEPGAETSPPSK